MAWSDFFVRTAQAGAAPSHTIPSLPLPATSFLPSLGFAGKQHVLTSKSRAREDQLLILHSSIVRAEEVQESHNILHVHHDQDRAMLTLQGEDPSALHIPHVHHVLQQSFGPSAQPSADWDSGKADTSKDIVAKTSRCSAFIHTPEVLYKASQQCQPSFTDGSQDSTRTQTICPIPSSRVVRQKQIPNYRPGLIQA